MERTEHIALWAIVGLTLVGLIIVTVVVFSELDEINQHLLVLIGGESPTLGEGGELSELATPVAAATSASPWGGQTTQIGIAGVTVLTDSVTMTITVRGYGAGDLLFEPPVLQSDEGQVYPITAESLEQARLAFLGLVTRGDVTVGMEFAGRLTPTEGLWLAFNASQEPTNVTAPPLRVAVPLRTGGD